MAGVLNRNGMNQSMTRDHRDFNWGIELNLDI